MSITKADFVMVVILYMYIRKLTNTIGREKMVKEWMLLNTYTQYIIQYKVAVSPRFRESSLWSRPKGFNR